MMRKFRTWEVLGVLVIVGALVITYSGAYPRVQNGVPDERVTAGTVSVTIAGLYENRSVAISERETILTLLHTLDAGEPSMQLLTTEYAGLGTLVEGMYGMRNGTDDKYWQYTVRGVMPMVGADVYQLTNGDSVEWTFATPQQ